MSNALQSLFLIMLVVKGQHMRLTGGRLGIPGLGAALHRPRVHPIARFAAALVYGCAAPYQLPPVSAATDPGPARPGPTVTLGIARGALHQRLHTCREALRLPQSHLDELEASLAERSCRLTRLGNGTTIDIACDDDSNFDVELGRDAPSRGFLDALGRAIDDLQVRRIVVIGGVDHVPLLSRHDARRSNVWSGTVTALGDPGNGDLRNEALAYARAANVARELQHGNAFPVRAMGVGPLWFDRFCPERNPRVQPQCGAARRVDIVVVVDLDQTGQPYPCPDGEPDTDARLLRCLEACEEARATGTVTRAPWHGSEASPPQQACVVGPTDGVDLVSVRRLDSCLDELGAQSTGSATTSSGASVVTDQELRTAIVNLWEEGG